MKKCLGLAFALLVGSVAQAATVDFETFNIRNANSGSPNPLNGPAWDTTLIINENAAEDGFYAETFSGGQKVGYGTNAFDGCQLNDIESVDWTKVSSTAGAAHPYLNIWVTDNAGNYAVISSENAYMGEAFGTRTQWKIFEYGGTNYTDPIVGNEFDWLFDAGLGGRSGSQYLTLNGSNASFNDISDNIVIFAGPVGPTAGVGSGAPRGGYGFNLIYGDTQNNFTDSYAIKDLTVDKNGVTYAAGAPVPEPATISLMLMGLGGLVARQRRKKA